MSSLSQQRCLNHFNREAVARCPECGQFFCRECITEHDDRVICASCLRKLLKPAEKRRPRLRGAVTAFQVALGLVTAWILFYFLGAALLRIPSSFHEGSFWEGGAGEAEP